MGVRVPAPDPSARPLKIKQIKIKKTNVTHDARSKFVRPPIIKNKWGLDVQCKMKDKSGRYTPQAYP